jgi:hypothetical protein
MSEKSLHAAICDYIRMQYPKVLFNSDLSGSMKLTIGQAVQLKKLRSSRGFPDLTIYEPRKQFHGLFLELKREGEVIYKRDRHTLKTPHLVEQVETIKRLNQLGYFAAFAIGFDEARHYIDIYLNPKIEIL